jgi:LuxR family maltose regulon positive regulatory protein
LTLVSAPAGFGKTTLLSDWVQTVQRPAVWISLDSGDDDPITFLHYIVAAFQRIDKGIGKSLSAVLNSRQSQSLSYDTLVALLLNDISSLASPCMIVLDDYHSISEIAVHEIVGLILARMPQQMHLVIASREDPSLPLPRLRAQGMVTELRARDLQFKDTEVLAFLNQTMELNIAKVHAEILAERTEGWIAGLQLAALSMQEHANRNEFIRDFAGNNRHIVDYLVDEVLSRQPEEILDFLLKTSILERFNGSLCDMTVYGDAVSGNSQEILEYLEQSNLFIIPLDNLRQWYRYHHLFANLLRNRLIRFVAKHQTEHDIIKPALLHRRAGLWFETNGYLNDAISHLLAASDFTLAAEFIERHGGELMQRGETVMLLKWLDALPHELTQARPLLCAYYAWVLLLTRSGSSSTLIESWLRRAEQALSASVESPFDPDSRLYDRVMAQVVVIRAYLARRSNVGNWQMMIDRWQQALAYLTRDGYGMRAVIHLNLGLDYLKLGEIQAASKAFNAAWHNAIERQEYFVAISAIHRYAYTLHRMGDLHAAVKVCRKTLREVVEPVEQVGHHLPVAAVLMILLGSILLEKGELDGTCLLLTEGLERIEALGAFNTKFDGYCAMARYRLLQGDTSKVLHIYQEMGKRWSGIQAKRTIAALYTRLWIVQSLLDLSYLDQAIEWANRIGHCFDDDAGHLAITDEWRYYRCLSLVRLHIAQKRLFGKSDLQPVLDYLERQYQIHDVSGLNECAIELLLLQSLALDAHDEERRALDILRKTLNLAEPAGYLLIFVEEGPPMARLLYKVVAQGYFKEYAGHILTTFEAVTFELSSIRSVGETSDIALIEPLSARELEVLHLISSGLSNKEIAQKLFISPRTVKRHTSSIYSKLNVHSRTQAVARANLLGLLPS